MINLSVNLYSRCKVTTNYVSLQAFSLLFLQLVATIVPIGDKSPHLPQNLSYYDDYFIFLFKYLVD